MQWQLIELNMLATLEEMCKGDTPAIVFSVKGYEDKAAIVQFLLKEHLGYHQVEKDVAERQLEKLKEEIKAYYPLEEYDPRTGEKITFYPADYDVIARQIEKLQQAVNQYSEALARFSGEDAEKKVLDILACYDIGDRSELDALKAAPGDRRLIELFGGSYGLEDDPETRLLLRRYYYDFPEDRDWL